MRDRPKLPAAGAAYDAAVGALQLWYRALYTNLYVHLPDERHFVNEGDRPLEGVVRHLVGWV